MSRLLAPVLIGVLGAAILVGLGVWQVQRLAWKEGVLAEIDSTIDGPVQELPRLIDPEVQRYMPVALTGEIGAEALFVLVSAKNRGAGWRVISAVQTTEGRRVLVDRGFAPVAEKDAALFAGGVEVVGNLHWPDDRNGSTPENDVAGNTWFARDIAPMAEALQTEPLLVVAREITPGDAHVTPLPVDSGAIPNDHLQYAVTWFSLAAIWLGMTGLWIKRRLRGEEG